MKNLKIEDIVKATNGELIVGNKEEICKKYSKDTRTIKPGELQEWQLIYDFWSWSLLFLVADAVES